MDLGGHTCTVTENRGDRSETVDLKKAIVEHCDAVISVLDKTYEKSLRTFYFDPEPKKGASNTTDITELDPGADSEIVSGWGGLSEFSGRIADIVAKVVGQDKAEHRE